MEMAYISGSRIGIGEPMTEGAQRRLVNHRPAAIRYPEESAGNVARTCRRFGTSRHAVYVWFTRFDVVTDIDAPAPQAME